MAWSSLSKLSASPPPCVEQASTTQSDLGRTYNMKYTPKTKHKFEFTPKEIKELHIALTARVDFMQGRYDDYDCEDRLGSLQMEFEDLARDLGEI
jgi:hypothetical protein